MTFSTFFGALETLLVNVDNTLVILFTYITMKSLRKKKIAEDEQVEMYIQYKIRVKSESNDMF